MPSGPGIIYTLSNVRPAHYLVSFRDFPNIEPECCASLEEAEAFCAAHDERIGIREYYEIADVIAGQCEWCDSDDP